MDGVRGANCYIVEAAEGLVIVDSGMPGNARRIIRYVEKLGKNLSDVKYVVFTHSDIDHVGSAARLKELTGAALAVHAKDAPMLSGKSGFKVAGGWVGMLVKATMWLMRFRPVQADVILEDGSRVNGLAVIATPGHTAGSISLYREPDAIIVGDALRSDANGNPKPPSRRFSADPALAKTSVAAISKLEFDVLLPGHGAPVIGGASNKVKTLVARME